MRFFFLTVLFLTVSTSAQAAVTCRVPEAPVITVTPRTAEIQYDTSMTSAQLGRMKSDTASPYAPGTDTATGGLREDRPQVRLEVSWGLERHGGQEEGLTCLWYRSVSVSVDMRPKIYIAKDSKFGGKACRDAIAGHEMKHVAADREVMNAFARRLGKALEKAVNEAGPMGPYPPEQVEGAQKALQARMSAILDAQQKVMHAEMAHVQGGIDSLAEYRRVDALCRAR